MVITRLQRAALCVQWAPNGQKFAIGSGTKSCCVCSYEEDNKWWAGKVIRKAHTSSVVCLAWHPDNIKLATGSTDGHCRVFHADKPGTQFLHTGIQRSCKPRSHAVVESVHEFMTACADGRNKFGALLACIDLQCWVNSISWDPAGAFIAAAGHDACVHIWDPQNSGMSSVILCACDRAKGSVQRALAAHLSACSTVQKLRQFR